MAAKRVPVERWERDAHHAATDSLGVEEPVEVRVEYSFKAKRETATLGLTLRSPGQDEDLACGLLYSEGWVTSMAEIESIHVGPDSVVVSLREGVEPQAVRRHQTRTSSCGLCGREELPDHAEPTDSTAAIGIEMLYGLPETLAAAQPDYQATGALHAAALFDLRGNLLDLREDIGRHNALDKLIGAQLRKSALPLNNYLILLSGRAGYELLQKCAAASTAFVAAIGAPSTMAVDLARRQNITLVGFLRKERCNIYTHPHRVERNLQSE